MDPRRARGFISCRSASLLPALRLSRRDVLSFADGVGHLHISDKLIVDKTLVVKPEAVYEIIVGKLFDLEELIAVDLLFEPKGALDEGVSHLVDS